MTRVRFPSPAPIFSMTRVIIEEPQGEHDAVLRKSDRCNPLAVSRPGDAVSLAQEVALRLADRRCVDLRRTLDDIGRRIVRVVCSRFLCRRCDCCGDHAVARRWRAYAGSQWLSRNESV